MANDEELRLQDLVNGLKEMAKGMKELGIDYGEVLLDGIKTVIIEKELKDGQEDQGSSETY